MFDIKLSIKSIYLAAFHKLFRSDIQKSQVNNIFLTGKTRRSKNIGHCLKSLPEVTELQLLKGECILVLHIPWAKIGNCIHINEWHVLRNVLTSIEYSGGFDSLEGNAIGVVIRFLARRVTQEQDASASYVYALGAPHSTGRWMSHHLLSTNQRRVATTLLSYPLGIGVGCGRAHSRWFWLFIFQNEFQCVLCISFVAYIF